MLSERLQQVASEQYQRLRLWLDLGEITAMQHFPDAKEPLPSSAFPLSTQMASRDTLEDSSQLSPPTSGTHN